MARQKQHLRLAFESGQGRGRSFNNIKPYDIKQSQEGVIQTFFKKLHPFRWSCVGTENFVIMKTLLVKSISYTYKHFLTFLLVNLLILSYY